MRGIALLFIILPVFTGTLPAQIQSRGQDSGYGVVFADSTRAIRGLSGGIAFSSFANAGSFEASATPGFAVGVFNLRPLSKRWGVLTEIYYAQKGMEVTSGGNTFNLQIDYVEVPVAARFYMPAGSVSFHLTGGGYLGILLGGSSTLRVFDDQALTPDDWLDTLNDVDGGVVVGTGIDFRPNSRIYGLTVRYARGFAHVFGRPAPALSNQSISLLLSISF